MINIWGDRGVHWSDLKLWPEVVTAANLVQEADLWLLLPQHLLFQRKSNLMHQLRGGTLKWLLHMIHCVSHLAVHAFKIFRGFKFEVSCACSNMACLMQLYLKFSAAKAKLHLALVVFRNVELNVQGTVQVCDFCN